MRGCAINQPRTAQDESRDTVRPHVAVSHKGEHGGGRPIDEANGRLGMRRDRTAALDLCAAGISTLCLIHCLALPLLVSVMPVIAQSVEESHLLHQILVLVAVPVSLRVIWKALPAGGNGLFVATASTGLGLLLLAAFVEAVSAYEEPITVAGGVLLGSAHVWHWVRHRGRVLSDGEPVDSTQQRTRAGASLG